MLQIVCLVLCAVALSSAQEECKPTITTATGYDVPKKICKDTMIFNEPFDIFNKTIWPTTSTFSDFGLNQFQWYVKDDENSAAGDSIVFLAPTLSSATIGSESVERGNITLDDCTDEDKANCARQAGENGKIINPVRSARITTKPSFSFKYGRVVLIAKTALGDWLWPSVQLMPIKPTYGPFPRSGSITMLESRGNLKYGDKTQIGTEQMSTSLHFGPAVDQDGYKAAMGTKNNETGYHSVMRTFEMLWDKTGITFTVDGALINKVEAGDGFWKKGGFKGDDIYKSGSKMAPFDQEFYFTLSLAVGGNFFPNEKNAGGPRPWKDGPTGMKEFYEARETWHKTWTSKLSSSFQIDDLKVFAV